MSHKLGMIAFVKRFERAFPTSEFNWTVNEVKGRNRLTIPAVIVPGMSLCFNASGGYTVFTISSKEGSQIAVVTMYTAFGSKIVVSSAFLPKQMNGFFMIYRRPLNLSWSTIYGRRYSLSRKVKKHPPQLPAPRPAIPNFKREGASLASAIKRNLKKVESNGS